VNIALADYGAGNVRSVGSAFARAGAEVAVTRDPAVVLETPLAVVAGVGHLASAVRSLERDGLADALRERAAASRPTLGICVGMQLLFEESDEGGEGLGLLRGPVRRLATRRVPHMGWNELRGRNGASILTGLDGADVYFAHSYACAPADLEVVAAETEHETTRIVAAVEHGTLAGVQFHPERSAGAGRRLLDNVLAWSRSA
jgi:glutamine amidotransferase